MSYLRDQTPTERSRGRGTQQTVSMNICSQDLLSPSSNFRDIGKVMPVGFGEIKMSFWVRKKAS